jgi:hypothetical protein
METGGRNDAPAVFVSTDVLDFFIYFLVHTALLKCCTIRGMKSKGAFR